MHTRRHSLGETGLRAFIILLIIYVACFTVGSLSPLSSPPASCEPMWPIMSGNKTVVDKPVEPVIIDEGQIPVGATWIYIYKLTTHTIFTSWVTGPTLLSTIPTMTSTSMRSRAPQRSLYQATPSPQDYLSRSGTTDTGATSRRAGPGITTSASRTTPRRAPRPRRGRS